MPKRRPVLGKGWVRGDQDLLDMVYVYLLLIRWTGYWLLILGAGHDPGGMRSDWEGPGMLYSQFRKWSPDKYQNNWHCCSVGVVRFVPGLNQLVVVIIDSVHESWTRVIYSGSSWRSGLITFGSNWRCKGWLRLVYSGQEAHKSSLGWKI